MRKYLLFIGFGFCFLNCLGQSQIEHPLCFEKCSRASLSGTLQRVEYYQYPSMNKYDLKYLKLELAIEANNRAIAGTATWKARTVQPLDTFIMELRNHMIIDSVFINGVKLNFQRGADHVFVPLSPALPIGSILDALFYYRGTAGNGFYAGTQGTTGLIYSATLSESYQAREWFPVKQILPDKIDSSEIWVTTDAGNMVGSNGLLTSTIILPNNKKQYRWKTRYKENYYMPSVAIGNYMEYTNYAKPAAMAPDSIPILHYIVNNNTYFNSIKANLDKTPPFVEKQSELFSLYPFRAEKYGHSHAIIGGAMEHQTMSTMSGFTLQLIAHELAHQWFGDNVTCATWNHIWVNEGFASYAEYLMIEHFPAFYAPTTPAAYMAAIHARVMAQAGGSVFVPDASIYDEGRIFNTRLTYDKGSAILHNLRFEFQNDNQFFQALRNYQQAFKDSVATANDFKQVCEAISGKNFTDFFNQWYYGEGYPTFNVDYSKQGDSIVLRINQTVSAPAVTSFFKGLYEFTINTNQGDTTVRIYQTLNDQLFKFRSSRTPTGVVIDPNNWVINATGSITTGFNDPINLSNHVVVFPNPSDGNFVIKYPSNSFQELIIFDDAGRKVFHESISPATTQRSIKTRLIPGIYLLRLDGKRKLAVKKIIVNK